MGALAGTVRLDGALVRLRERPLHLLREDYLTVQQIYRGWALLGDVVIGALVCTAALAVRTRRARAEFGFTAGATLCIAISLVVFFAFTFPTNQQTANWTILPGDWEALRRRWEFSHAAGAGLYFCALSLLTLSLLVRRRG